MKKIIKDVEVNYYQHSELNNKCTVSLLILVYNAPLLTLKTLLSLKETRDIAYETIVLDNKSHLFTKIMLFLLFKFKYISKLIYCSENTFFAKGNNIASKFATDSSKYYLLLNSDVEIIRSDWLKKLLSNHLYGISSIGVVDKVKSIARCDGYCLLIDKDLYDKYELDEEYKWWYGVTKLNAQILKEPNCIVKGYVDKSVYIKHYWGGSGKAYKKVNKVLPVEKIEEWFDTDKRVIIENEL